MLVQSRLVRIKVFRRPTHLGCEVSAVKSPVEEGGVPVPISVEYEEVDPVIGSESDLLLHPRGVGFIQVTPGGDFGLLMNRISGPRARRARSILTNRGRINHRSSDRGNTRRGNIRRNAWEILSFQSRALTCGA